MSVRPSVTDGVSIFFAKISLEKHNSDLDTFAGDPLFNVGSSYAASPQM